MNIRGYLPKPSEDEQARSYPVMEDYKKVGEVSVQTDGGNSTKYTVSYRESPTYRESSPSFEGTLYKHYRRSKKSGRQYLSHYKFVVSWVNHVFVGSVPNFEDHFVFKSKNQWGGIEQAIELMQNFEPTRYGIKGSKEKSKIPIIGGFLAGLSALGYWFTRRS